MPKLIQTFVANDERKIVERALKPDVRKILMREAEILPDRVTILLSAGIDSAAVMFAVLEAGKHPVALSFGFEDAPSTDLKMARETAKKLSVPWRPVWLPRDTAETIKDLKKISDAGADRRRNTTLTCVWPMMRAIVEAETDVVTGGVGSDGYFCLSKKGCMHWKDKIDDWRIKLYRDPLRIYNQQIILENVAEMHGKTVRWPFFGSGMLEEFLGTTWEEVNKPRQKEPILLAFPREFGRIDFVKHTNLHLGDSGIKDHVNRCLKMIK